MDASNQIQKILQDFKTELISSMKSELAPIKFDQLQRMPFSDYLESEGICRHTGYNRRERGQIQTEKIGNKLYVILGPGTRSVRKYQRESEHA